MTGQYELYRKIQELQDKMLTYEELAQQQESEEQQRIATASARARARFRMVISVA